MALISQENADSISFSLVHEDVLALARTCGENNVHLSQIERHLNVYIGNNGYKFHITGSDSAIGNAKKVIEAIYHDALEGKEINGEEVHLYLQQSSITGGWAVHSKVQTPRLQLRTRGYNQQRFVSGIREHAIHFGIGPAGTGKTWLAVACALERFFDNKVERLILTRPAVEAGEKLGFLPGDLTQKIDPYLHPLFDALYGMVGHEKVDRLIDKGLIEIAPLAFMRGRSLNNACVILDEGQNTTPEQMKMFLTRIGFGSQAIITGDVSQVDLPRNTLSGLIHASNVLHKIKGIGFTFFKPSDVVRHPVVQAIVQAYEADNKIKEGNNDKSTN